MQTNRWIAYGFRKYFKDGWSCLDFLIVLVSIASKKKNHLNIEIKLNFIFKAFCFGNNCSISRHGRFSCHKSHAHAKSSTTIEDRVTIRGSSRCGQLTNRLCTISDKRCASLHCILACV